MSGIAICTIRAQPAYRQDAFVAGLQRAGYKVEFGWGKPRARDDLYVIWNRYGSFETDADSWERQGGTVLVVENGYIGGDAQGRPTYAIAVHQHNGAGWWPIGTENRWDKLGIELQPWREHGEYVLVCGQRGIGSRVMASPANWHELAAERLRDVGMNVRVRTHPGSKGSIAPPTTTLDEDFAGASACAIWSSSSGIKSLILGIPVVYDAPHWVCEAAARRGMESIVRPVRDDQKRLTALNQMAHAQWTVAEIESGEPFVRIRAQLPEVEWEQ